MSNLKHGGEGALVRLRKGEPFDGLALATYDDVLDELGLDLDKLSGIDAMRARRAARFEAVARMFDAAAQMAASTGDVDKWERYQCRAGWMGGKSFSALTELRTLLIGSGGLVVDAVSAAREVGDGDK